jgi:hypothetical protein
MGFKFKLEGVDEMRRKLETLKRRANNLAGPVAFEDLFPPEFMRRHTDCKTIDELFSDLPIESQEDFEKLSVSELDQRVQAKTRFTSWDDMKARAGEEYMARRLDIGNL